MPRKSLTRDVLRKKKSSRRFNVSRYEYIDISQRLLSYNRDNVVLVRDYMEDVQVTEAELLKEKINLKSLCRKGMIVMAQYKGKEYVILEDFVYYACYVVGLDVAPHIQKLKHCKRIY